MLNHTPNLNKGRFMKNALRTHYTPFYEFVNNFFLNLQKTSCVCFLRCEDGKKTKKKEFGRLMAQLNK